MLTNILIFTGAGASVQFSKPDTSGFRQQLSQKYEGSDLMKSFLDCPGFEDIEHVLESLKDFELAHNNHMTQYLKNAVLPGIASNTIDFFKNLTSQRDNLRSDIMSDLFQTYKWDGKNNDEKTRKFYGDLFNIVSKYSSKAYVGTTNYDQAIEQGCALSNLKYECIDGFEYFKNDISKWNGKKFTEEYNGQGMPVYLYKIHGSLTWKHDGSGNIEKNTRDITYERGSGQNVLIAPTLSPKTAQSKEPFKTLLTELENKLENVDVCIVIGFSFRDKHVGELFQKFIENGKNFIVISPSSFINYCENLFDKKLSSDEARSAWFRQHRTGKNIHFISERVNEDNNGKVFKQLEETLSKISKTIVTSNTKNDKKINQNLSDPLNKNELSQKEKDEKNETEKPVLQIVNLGVEPPDQSNPNRTQYHPNLRNDGTVPVSDIRMYYKIMNRVVDLEDIIREKNEIRETYIPYEGSILPSGSARVNPIALERTEKEVSMIFWIDYCYGENESSEIIFNVQFKNFQNTRVVPYDHYVIAKAEKEWEDIKSGKRSAPV